MSFLPFMPFLVDNDLCNLKRLGCFVEEHNEPISGRSKNSHGGSPKATPSGYGHPATSTSTTQRCGPRIWEFAASLPTGNAPLAGRSESRRPPDRFEPHCSCRPEYPHSREW